MTRRREIPISPKQILIAAKESEETRLVSVTTWTGVPYDILRRTEGLPRAFTVYCSIHIFAYNKNVSQKPEHILDI